MGSEEEMIPMIFPIDKIPEICYIIYVRRKGYERLDNQSYKT